jgi:phage-related protein
MMSSFARGVAAVLATLAFGAGTAPVQADGRRAGVVPVLPQYQQECGSCHVAYPPALLPAASWQRLMNNLPRHYGVDASVESATANQLSAWLAAHAGASRRARQEPPDDRITRSAWFVREHDEVRAAVWQRPAVKSPANCGACHAQADQGVFDEHDIRIPR